MLFRSPAEDPFGDGSLTFEDVRMRYRTSPDDVLRGVSFFVPGGARLGVVGRTGAGKSTLASCVFRLVPLSEGRVLVGGADLSALPLETVRSRLGVVCRVV